MAVFYYSSFLAYLDQDFPLSNWISQFKHELQIAITLKQHQTSDRDSGNIS